MPDREPVLVVINQTVNPAFNQWLGHLAGQIGPVELWAGNACGEMPQGVSVRHAPAYDRSSATSRLRTWLQFTVWVAAALLRRGGRTPLFVVTNPPFMPLLAWLLFKWQGRPFGLLEWDIYPDILAPMGLAGPRQPVYRLWRAWHGRALRAAGLVVTLGDLMAARLRTLAGDPHLPILVIPNWVDTGWIGPRARPDNSFAREHRLNGHLTVLYSGNLGATHAIETVVAVAERLRQASNIRFLIIGEGSKRALVESAIRENRTPTLELLPLQPAAALPLTLSAADVGIVTLSEGYEGLSMPSKTYSLMAAGSAILGISRPPNDLAAAITRHGCGANFEPAGLAAITGWLQELAADPDRLSGLRSRARQAALEYYSAPHCQQLLSEAVRQHLLSPEINQPA